MAKPAAVEVLLDNYTLQGAYGYLRESRHGRAFDRCLAHLVEAVVLYDRLLVPADVLDRNAACQAIAAQLPGVLEGRQMPSTPDIHHHLILREIVDQFQPLLASGNPFGVLEDDNAHRIERIGHPFPSRPGWMGRHERDLSFAERHTYYTWYCIRLASALGINYAPSPLRVPLVTTPGFMDVKAFPDFANDLVEYFEKVRQEYVAGLAEVFKSLGPAIDLPLVYNHVRSQVTDSADALTVALDVRQSKTAVAFRDYCRELQNALETDPPAVGDRVQEIKKLADQWSKSLSKSRGRRTWTFSWFIGTDFQTRWFNLQAQDRKPHFMFLHRLLTTPTKH